MRKFLILFLLLTSGAVQAQGIQFFKGTLAELFAKARAEQKHIYVDVYTTWCGPCQLMARQVFPDSAVGAYMAPRFVSYKLNAEKGEGPAFAKKHGVTGYPTGLYFNPEGELVYSNMGFNDTKGWFESQGNIALKESADPQNLAFLKKEYAAGKSDTAFLKKILTKEIELNTQNDGTASRATQLFRQLTPAQQIDISNLRLLTLANVFGHDTVLAHSRKYLEPLLRGIAGADRDKIATALGDAGQNNLYRVMPKGKTSYEYELAEYLKTSYVLDSLTPEDVEKEELTKRLEAAGRGVPDILIPRVPQLVAKYYTGLSDTELKRRDSVSYAGMAADIESMIASGNLSGAEADQVRAMNKGMGRAVVANNLNNAAWTYFELKRPTPELKLALTWIDEALRIAPKDHNAMDTKAHLLASLGRRPEALQLQRKAVAQGKAAGADTEELEAYLKKLEKQAAAKPKARK